MTRRAARRPLPASPRALQWEAAGSSSGERRICGTVWEVFRVCACVVQSRGSSLLAVAESLPVCILHPQIEADLARGDKLCRVGPSGLLAGLQAGTGRYQQGMGLGLAPSTLVAGVPDSDRASD